MDLEQIELALREALGLRVPTFKPDTPVREKMEAFEDYMLASALVNGNLVEARHDLRLIEQFFADRWERMTGWEVGLGRTPLARATKQEINEAKRAMAPADFDAGRKARQLREGIDDQIVRLRFEEEKVIGRTWGLITG